jgi:hypothetical protein
MQDKDNTLAMTITAALLNSGDPHALDALALLNSIISTMTPSPGTNLKSALRHEHESPIGE